MSNILGVHAFLLATSFVPVFHAHADNVETATMQPFIIHNLDKGWYLRSTRIRTFDLKNDTHYIPLGSGGGKVWKSGLNSFIEPQRSRYEDKPGVSTANAATPYIPGFVDLSETVPLAPLSPHKINKRSQS